MSLSPTPLPTPTHGPPSFTSFTVTSTTRILASPGTCLQIVLDVSKYPEWNRFIPVATLDSSPSSSPNSHFGPGTLSLGRKFAFSANMNAGTDGPDTKNLTQLVVTVLGEVDEETNEEMGVGGVFERLRPGVVGTGEKRRHRVAWAQRSSWSMPGWLLRSERVQEFRLVKREEMGGKGLGGCDYVCWETFYGVLAPVVRLAVGAKLATCFGVWGQDLKARAEKLEGGLGA